MPLPSDQSQRSNAASPPFSSMSDQLYPQVGQGRVSPGVVQLQDDTFTDDPVHDAIRQVFDIESNQKQGGDDADKAIGLVKDFASHQAWKNSPLTFDEAKNTVMNHVVKTQAAQGNTASTIPALVYTDMSGGKTWFHNPDTNENFEIQTSNAVTSNAKEGADSPYIGNITRCEVGELKNAKAFGTAKIYTTDNRQRWIHGGGTGLDDPLAPRQGWKPTQGCTRGQNEDVEQLCRKIQQWQTENPDRTILYIRTRSMNP